MSDPKLGEASISTDSETIEEESPAKLTEDNLNIKDISKDPKRRQSIIPSSHQPQRVNNIALSDDELNSDDREDEASFDSFILSNFNPFSGSGNVIDWLDNTDQKFKLHKIPRNLRYMAIPLLVEGEAKRKYIRIRGDIRSFDDFYEFLLIHYGPKEQVMHNASVHSSFYSSDPNNVTQDCIISKNVTFDDQQKMRAHNLDLSDNLPPRPILRSTALADFGATKFLGDDSAYRSAIAPSSNTSHITSNLDQTTYVIHKAIIDNLIKNPKIFQGGKEDVKQWLEDIEQLFDTAQIPDSHKLDLISYSLRGEARRWYKNIKSTLTSWSIFVKEIKEAFLSPFHDELAFKKLESYSQGINQPVRSFYNEVLKLCNDTDPDMSEAMKLRHLLKKAKPTIQYEIRKKKPMTTKQFLEYAKEQEELLQLSNIDVDAEINSFDRKLSNTHNHGTSPIVSTQPGAYSSNYKSNFTPTYDQTAQSNSFPHNTKYNKYNTQVYNTYQPRSIQPVDSFNSLGRRNDFYASNQPWRSNQPFSPNVYRARDTFRFSDQRTHPSTRRYSNTQLDNRNSVQTSQLNNISATLDTSPSQPTPLLSNPDSCTNCLETGHQASACPRF